MTWQEDVEAELERNALDRPKRKNGTEVRMPVEHLALVNMAARQRGIARSSYMRRAILAMAIYDLGLQWSQVMRNEDPLRSYTETAGGSGDRVMKPRGKGFGSWIIESLKAPRG